MPQVPPPCAKRPTAHELLHLKTVNGTWKTTSLAVNHTVVKRLCYTRGCLSGYAYITVEFMALRLVRLKFMAFCVNHYSIPSRTCHFADPIVIKRAIWSTRTKCRAVLIIMPAKKLY